MGFLKVAGRVTAALTLLVVVVPARESRADVIACKDQVCPGRLGCCTEQRLVGATAAELIDETVGEAEHSWAFDPPAISDTPRVEAPAMEPRITSVPVALIVGGAMIASLSVTRQVRRTRAQRI